MVRDSVLEIPEAISKRNDNISDDGSKVKKIVRVPNKKNRSSAFLQAHLVPSFNLISHSAASDPKSLSRGLRRIEKK